MYEGIVKVPVAIFALPHQLPPTGVTVSTQGASRFSLIFDCDRGLVILSDRPALTRFDL